MFDFILGTLVGFALLAVIVAGYKAFMFVIHFIVFTARYNKEQ